MDWLTREWLGSDVIPEWELDEKPGPIRRRRWPRPRRYNGEEVEQHRMEWCGTADPSVPARGCDDPYAAKHRRLLDVIRRWSA